ncbi:unnamed protein product [Gordionus sp. m RMFG-2023]
MSLRICGDLRLTINKYLDNDSGGKIFSTIDLRDTFLQFEVSPECKDLLVISTHVGYYRYLKNPFWGD